ncbi:hypothetical protein H4R18_001513 [Coemansia javaensis]|uniref:PAS domain-containing protein n=1 Tax=Coemansia javaensis TaxID=2761396 RepID=A0A9W8HDI5_9FUNG|nr:hypothetical protein H4R18_001513 [Coemansia javaensis]
MEDGSPLPQQAAAPESAPRRHSYIGINSRDESTRMLYISSGVYEAIGFSPEAIVNTGAKDFVSDQFDMGDLKWVFQGNGSMDEDEDNDTCGATVVYLNVKTASGASVMHRVTSFKLDSVIVYISMTLPEITSHGRKRLGVATLDGKTKLLGTTRAQSARLVDQEVYQHTWKNNMPIYYSRARHLKVAFVLENPSPQSSDYDGGPLVAFATGSVSRLIDVEVNDLMGTPFLKLVAPEDVLHVSRLFERAKGTTDLLFEQFTLLQCPHPVGGGPAVADEDNQRVVVECMAASSQDGVALLLRKLHVVSAPKRDTMGNYIRTKVHEIDDDTGYISLAELISSDPETSDAPEWSVLAGN